MTYKSYAGIGSRQTPADVLILMKKLAAAYALEGWTLRSGHADGADTAFEDGCESSFGSKEIFLPWDGYNNTYADSHRGYYALNNPNAELLAKIYHPVWQKCSPGARKLHARNMHIMLGKDLDTPVDVVVCWTKDGRVTGGTGQALRAAADNGIAVLNLAFPDVRREAESYLLLHTS